MNQKDTIHLAQEFLGRMGSGAEPAEIAKLFSETLWRRLKQTLTTTLRSIGSEVPTQVLMAVNGSESADDFRDAERFCSAIH